MPTGYTASVADGTTTTLRAFALQCARAFGATVTMRDDPMSAEIPERFEPGGFYRRLMEQATTWAELKPYADQIARGDLQAVPV